MNDDKTVHYPLFASSRKMTFPLPNRKRPSLPHTALSLTNYSAHDNLKTHNANRSRFSRCPCNLKTPLRLQSQGAVWCEQNAASIPPRYPTPSQQHPNATTPGRVNLNLFSGPGPYVRAEQLPLPHRITPNWTPANPIPQARVH